MSGLSQLGNTGVRIISSFALVLIVVLFSVIGKNPCLFFLAIIGALIVDEIEIHFFKLPRWNWKYFLTQAVFVVPFLFFNFLEQPQLWFDVFVNIGIVADLALLFFLFSTMSFSVLKGELVRRYSFLSALLVLCLLAPFSVLFHLPEWRKLIVFIMILVFSVDTAAWFFGRKFGKNKLWPAVSPNKTVEGAVGGLVVSTLLSTLCWWLFFGEISLSFSLFFALLAILSQFGDLAQSKLKRLYEIKDSSRIIPGHGGVYDRLDALLFVIPFYVFGVLAFMGK